MVHPKERGLSLPNSIKVALGIGQLPIGKLLFGSYSSKALHCVLYAGIVAIVAIIWKPDLIETLTHL